jgi:hypothetical protein
MELKGHFQRLWRGRVTARGNVGFLIPIWLWFVYLVWIETRRSGEEFLCVTFLPALIASMIPFFLRRLGLVRWWVLAAAIPATAAAVVVQLLRNF